MLNKVSAKIQVKALKKSEKLLQRTLEKQYKWAYDYLSKYYPVSFVDYRSVFMAKYKVKQCVVDSFLFNILKTQYYGYCAYLHLGDIDKNYLNYCNCCKSYADSLKTID